MKVSEIEITYNPVIKSAGQLRDLQLLDHKNLLPDGYFSIADERY